MVENIDFEELCLHFSNRANPKQQLDASNQFYSMLWSQETDLQESGQFLENFEILLKIDQNQTILNYLLEYGINSEDENIASGAMRHLPIILLKNFRSVDLDLTPLIKSLLLKKNDPDAAQLGCPLYLKVNFGDRQNGHF